MEPFQGGLVFKAHGLLYHSTLGSEVIKKKKNKKYLLAFSEHLRLRHPLLQGCCVGRYTAAWKLELKHPWRKGQATKIIFKIMWIRTSRLFIKNPCVRGLGSMRRSNLLIQFGRIVQVGPESSRTPTTPSSKTFSPSRRTSVSAPRCCLVVGLGFVGT